MKKQNIQTINNYLQRIFKWQFPLQNMEKKGEMLKASSALLGTIFLFISLYFLSIENLLYGAIIGIIGILMITISVMLLKRP